MPVFSKCLKSGLRITDEEATEILDLADKLRREDKNLPTQDAHIRAVEQLLEGLRGTEATPVAASAPAAPAPEPLGGGTSAAETPAPAPPAADLKGSPFAGLGGDRSTKPITDKIATEATGGFDKLVETARKAGDITALEAKALKKTAVEDLTKAKGDLLTLREAAAEKKQGNKKAIDLWNDPGFNWSEGDPKFEDLSPEQQKVWTVAVGANNRKINLTEVWENIRDLYNTGKEKTSRVSAASVIETPAFKAWFGDSKVVDKNGKPMVVYHGTRGDFDTFNSRGFNGFYFSSDPDYSALYAKQGAEHGALMPVYLSIKNPKIIPLGASAEVRGTSMHISDEQMAALKAQGYDGIINRSADEIVAFEPSQIKSAIGNSGRFDPNDDKINRVKNPDDRGMKVDLSTPEMKQGRSAAAWLAKHAKEEWMRPIAARIQATLDEDVPIHVLPFNEHGFMNADDRGVHPHSVEFNLSHGALGTARTVADGSTTIYFRSDTGTSEGELLHELLHAATQRGLVVSNSPALVAKMNVLTKTIQRSMRFLRDDATTSEARETADFFAQVVDNPDELLAYGLSSSSFRKLLETLNWDGTQRTFKEEYQDDTTRRMAPEVTDKPLTLWQRFVDWVRDLIGLSKKYAPALERLMAWQEIDRQVYLTENLTQRMTDRLDSLLAKALEAQAVSPTLTSAKETNKETKVTGGGQTGSKIRNVPGTINIPEFLPQHPLAKALKDAVPGWKNKPAVLGWWSMRQLADHFGKKYPRVAQYADMAARLGAKAKTIMGESHKVDKLWQLVKDTKEMHTLMIESTLDQIWPNKSFESQPHLVKQDNPQLRNRHAALAAKWDKLSPQAKETFVAVEGKMRKDWEERGRLLKSSIVDLYRAELYNFDIDKAADVTDKVQRGDIEGGVSRPEKKSLRALWSDLDDHAERLSQMQGPYFPLMRFGEHVVVAKSGDLISARTSFEDAQEELKALNSDEDSPKEDLKEAREKVKKLQGELEALKDNEDHYIVEFYESRSDAEKRKQQLKQHFTDAGKNMQVEAERRSEHFSKLDGVSPSFMKKLEASLSSALPDKDANAVRRAVRDLYIQQMPDRSALKAQLRRIGVKGVKENEMRRAFAASSMRAAWHLSRLEYGAKMNRLLGEIRESEEDDEKVVGSEFAKRLVATLQQDTSNLLIDRITNLSYLTYLGFSPSFMIINAMQPWIVSLPIMAARYGMTNSVRELGKSFNEVGGKMIASARDQNTWRFELDLDKFTNKQEREMLQELFNGGIIDITIEHDQGAIASGKDVGWFGTTMQMASVPAHHTEVVNRVMTALTAYRLATRDGTGEQKTHEAATKYAEKIVADTHLDYTPENSPRFMRSTSLGGLGRVIFQFKKYTQGMIFLIGKLGVDTAKGDKEALKGVAYLTGMQLATAGAVGLPLAAPISALGWMVAQMYPDDDKPEFFLQFYRALKDMLGETVARAIMKGLPAALLHADLSSRVGLGNILNPLAFVPSDKEGKDYVAHAALALAGPAASMAGNWADALQVAKDDPIKAAAMAVPKFMADPIRAIDRANRGVTNRRGDTLLPPEEFGPLGIVMRGAGFEDVDVTDTYDVRGAFLNAKDARDTVRNRLLRHIVEARMEGEDTTDLEEKRDAYNERHPDNPITAAQIRSSEKGKRVTAASLKEGVAIRKNDRALAEKLGIGQ